MPNRYEVYVNHAAFYVSSLRKAEAEFLIGKSSFRQGLSHFDYELDNINAGQNWAAKHCEEHKSAAEFVSAYASAAPNIMRVRQHPQERIRWIKKALEVETGSGNEKKQLIHIGNLGQAFADNNDIRIAIKLYKEQIEMARKTGDRRGENDALGNLGNAYFIQGKAKKAIIYQTKNLQFRRETKDKLGEGYALGSLGISTHSLGNISKAKDYYKQWLKLSIEISNQYSEAQALHNLGIAQKDLGQTTEAIKSFQKSFAIKEEIGDRRGQSNTLGSLAVIYTKLGKLEMALELYLKSIEIAKGLDVRGEATDYWNMSLALYQSGRINAAVKFAEKALKLREDIEDTRVEKVRRKLLLWREEMIEK